MGPESQTIHCGPTDTVITRKCLRKWEIPRKEERVDIRMGTLSRHSEIIQERLFYWTLAVKNKYKVVKINGDFECVLTELMGSLTNLTLVPNVKHVLTGLSVALVKAILQTCLKPRLDCFSLLFSKYYWIEWAFKTEGPRVKGDRKVCMGKKPLSFTSR